MVLSLESGRTAGRTSRALPTNLRSHSGPGASEALSVCPSKPEFCIEAGSFELWSSRDSDCPCRSLKLSANAGSSWTDKAGTELRVLVPDDAKRGARVCREAGATVRCNARLRDMNVVVAAHDDRAIEVLAKDVCRAREDKERSIPSS